MRQINADALAAQVIADAMDEAIIKGLHNANSKKYSRFLALIATAPTVDAEPVRHGKWIKEDEMKNLGGDDRVQTHMYYTVYRCSNCHSIGSTDYKYCPYCGADMRGEE